MSKFLFVLPLFLFAGCANYGQLKVITDLPHKLSETSGMVQFSENSVWIIEDSGNSDNLYQVNLKGKFIGQFDVSNAKNNDWEDLTKDKTGNIYIGDFGNNENRRKHLVIYKLPNPEKEPGDKIKAEKIVFNYPEQKQFPPKKNALLFDAEAFFHHGNHLYILTRNRTKPFTGEAYLYKVPDQPGAYDAEFMGKITTCKDSQTCQITSADISPDGRTIVLLGNGKLWVITDFQIDNLAKAKRTEIDLGVRTQLESVCFKDNTTLLLSDEVRNKEGGNLYSYSLN